MDSLKLLFSQNPELHLKYEAITNQLAQLGQVAVAYSGGVDSATLLKICANSLGDNCIALIGVSPSIPKYELEEAVNLAKVIGVHCESVQTSEMEDPDYLENSPQRCFHCRINSFKDLQEQAYNMGYNYLLDGANADDDGDYRPGRQAAKNLEVLSPLHHAGITKKEVRLLAKALELPVWDKPASACLASRIPYGTSITAERLGKIATAELALKQMGFGNIRVRHYDDLARIEIESSQLEEAIHQRQAISDALKQIGYTYITLDLEGLRSGSMNLTIIGD